MLINADFTRRAVLHTAGMDWVQSPMAGVERRMLDRIGGEVARATTVVRYAPGSAFSPHTHDGGEEFLVLDGVFQDEHGDYPAGSYVRNPPTSRHTPRSEAGCTILVKLHQFDPADRTEVRIVTPGMESSPVVHRPGVARIPLFDDIRETVRIEHWSPGATVHLDLPGGFEGFVLDGGFVESGETLTPSSWLRLPAGARLDAVAGSAGARIWIKTGHLPPAPSAGLSRRD